MKIIIVSFVVLVHLSVPFSFSVIRMNCPVRTVEAPSPVLLPPREVPPKVDRLCLHKLEDPNPTVSCPPRAAALKTPPHLHTMLTLSPSHHCLLTMECQLSELGLPLPHPCLLQPPMSPWSLWICRCTSRKFQTGSTRTWTGTMGNQRAVRILQRCRKDNRVLMVSNAVKTPSC